jgi:hypothetical protein
MRSLCLWKVPIRFLFRCVNEIGKLDGVLNEKHRDIIANEVPIPLFGVELNGEASHVTR